MDRGFNRKKFMKFKEILYNIKLDKKYYSLFSLKFIYLIFYRIDYFFRHSYLKRLKFYIFTSGVKKFFEYVLKIEIVNHTPYLYVKGGIFLNNNCKVIYANIGYNCIVNVLVNIGAIGKRNKITNSKYPKMGNNVLIGANATILSPVIIGDNVIIGRGVIVTKDVPNNKIVMRINEIKEKNEKYNNI
jgi:serine acetyltransferase